MIPESGTDTKECLNGMKFTYSLPKSNEKCRNQVT